MLCAPEASTHMETRKKKMMMDKGEENEAER